MNETELKRVYEIGTQAGLPWLLEAYVSHAHALNTYYIVENDAFIALSIVLDEAEVINIAVVPSQQGKGIGKRLWQQAEKLMRERGVNKCFLEVRASNMPARRLYEACGFVKIGERQNYYTQPNEDAWVYCWEKK